MKKDYERKYYALRVMMDMLLELSQGLGLGQGIEFLVQSVMVVAIFNTNVTVIIAIMDTYRLIVSRKILTHGHDTNARNQDVMHHGRNVVVMKLI
jgi:hypothetical protein